MVAGGVVGADTPAAADRVIKALRGELRGGVADVLELSKVDPEHPVHAAAARGLGWYRRGHGSPVYLRHRSDLSRGFDAFLAGRSKGTRWRVRKRLRMLTEPASTTGKLTVRQVGPVTAVVAAPPAVGNPLSAAIGPDVEEVMPEPGEIWLDELSRVPLALVPASSISLSSVTTCFALP